MNGVHDMGGMHGFGPVDVDDDAAFHGEWERAVFGVEKLLRYQSIYGVDEKRHAVERIDPATYLGASYFERWALAAETLLREGGTVTEGELEAAIEDEGGTELFDRDLDADAGGDDLVDLANEAFRTDAAYDRDSLEPRFEAGEAVLVRNDHPEGHTRCPRYVRRARGTVDAVQGTFVVPDEAAHGEETAEPLYSVRFEAEELWNDDTDGDAVYVDLWERYLRPPAATDGDAEISEGR